MVSKRSGSPIGGGSSLRGRPGGRTLNSRRGGSIGRGDDPLSWLSSEKLLKSFIRINRPVLEDVSPFKPRHLHRRIKCYLSRVSLTSDLEFGDRFCFYSLSRSTTSPRRYCWLVRNRLTALWSRVTVLT